jgi:hypothetical protein
MPKPAPAREHVVTLKVGADGAFTVTEQRHAFSGKGSFSGKAWEWFAWQSFTKLADGSVVESQDQRWQDAITSRKTISGRDGRILALVQEKLSKVEPAEYDERYRLAFPARK